MDEALRNAVKKVARVFCKAVKSGAPLLQVPVELTTAKVAFEASMYEVVLRDMAVT